MTEADAKKKYCPLLVVAQPMLSHLCLAADCMMWRLFSVEQVVKEKRCDGEGYCGLAGKP